jgi:hypothetical protein
MKSAIVEFLTPDAKKGEKEYNDDELFNISLNNVINNASWNLSDVIFSTPVVISHILDTKSKYSPFDINPRTIVIDEFDAMIANPQLSSHLLKILRKFGQLDTKNTNNYFSGSVNQHRQIILCGSTIPK